MATLADHPSAQFIIACEACGRVGAYRIARLAAKYGPDADLWDVVRDLTWSCRYRTGMGRFAGCKARIMHPGEMPEQPVRERPPLRLVRDDEGE